MTPSNALWDDFGMDTVSLAGSLEAKLEAICDGGFAQVMLSTRDLVSHPNGFAAACQAVRASGLRITGMQVLRDFEAGTGQLRDHKRDVAAAMLDMCAEISARVLLVCSSTLSHAATDREQSAAALHELAELAAAREVRIAYEPLSWAHAIHELPAAWDVISRADAPNLGLAIDSFHCLATRMSPRDLDAIDAAKVFVVQLGDVPWRDISPEERITTARHFRVFPGEGAHTAEIAQLVQRLIACGYRGDFSFEVFNDDYAQLKPSFVAGRARRATEWLGAHVLQRPRDIAAGRIATRASAEEAS